MGKEYLDRLAPCGLHCGKCFAFAGGDINRHSAELKRIWETSDRMQKGFQCS